MPDNRASLGEVVKDQVPMFSELLTSPKADVCAAAKRNEARYRGAGRCWETPPDLFERLNDEFKFTLDPCCTEQTAKCARYFTEQMNGLLQDWSGEIVFMNPPYGAELPRWTRKAADSAEQGAIVVGLLPASVDSAWFHDDVLGTRAEIRYLRGRVRFKVGKLWASPFQPNIIVVWRPPSGEGRVPVQTRPE